MKELISTNRLPEKLNYTKYYEHDGMLRAYANRTMILAMMFGVIAIGSLSFAVYLRLQPPTVVRVDPNGESTAVSSLVEGENIRTKMSFHVAAASETEPSELEARALVRRFLEAYLNYAPGIAERSFAEALNMMTSNLRCYTMTKLREDDIVAKIKEVAVNPYAPNNNLTKLQGRAAYRLRVGNWRVIYELHDDRQPDATGGTAHELDGVRGDRREGLCRRRRARPQGPVRRRLLRRLR